MAYDRQILSTIAVAKVTGTITSTGGAISNRGFKTIMRTGPGVYTLERESGMTGPDEPTAEVYSTLTVNTASLYGIAQNGVDNTGTVNTTMVTVRTYDAAASATDADFTLVVERLTNHETPST